jgi:hypothetical protein
VQYAIVTVNQDGRVTADSTVTIGPRTTTVPIGPEPGDQRIAAAIRSLGYRIDNGRSHIRRTDRYEFPVRPRPGVSFTARFTGRRLEVRMGRWGSGEERTPIASAVCRTLDRAPRSAAEVGFALSRRWEDCGDGTYATECWPA